MTDEMAANIASLLAGMARDIGENRKAVAVLERQARDIAEALGRIERALVRPEVKLLLIDGVVR